MPFRGNGVMRSSAWAWVPIILALVLRLAFVAATPEYKPLLHDDAAYDRMGCRISQDGTFPPYTRTIKVQPSAYRPPVYPYFLGGIDTLTGCNPDHSPASMSAWPRIAGGLLGAIVVAMVAWLGARWWSRRAGFAAGMLAAIFGPSVVVGSQFLSEQLFAAIVLAAVVAAVLARDATGRRRLAWVAVAGLATGLAALTRTNGALLIPVLAAAVWVGRPRWSRRALAAPVLLMLVAVLVITPWTLRNLRELHVFVPVSDEAGGTLAGTYNDVARTDSFAPTSWHRPEEVPAYRPLFRYARRVQLAEVPMQHRLQNAALRYARAHPGYVAEVGYWNTLRLAGIAGHTELLADARSLGLPEWPVRLAWSTSTFTLLLALAGLATGCARGSPRFVWVAALLLVLSTVFVNADALRFQVPFGPFEALLGGAAVAGLLEVARSRASRRAAALAR